MNRIALASILFIAACATADEPVEPTAREVDVYEIVPVEPTPQLDDEGRPIRGTLDLDTSKGRMDITHLVPLEPREFKTWDDFHAWAAEQLNAVIVANEKGEITSELRAGWGPTVRYQDGEEIAVDDPITTIIGGPWGYIVVDGKQFCMDPAAACAAEQTVTPARMENHIGTVVTKQNNGLTITGASSIFHLIAIHEIKAATRLDTSRSYYYYTYGCGFLGWGRCVATGGYDRLSASFSAYRSTGSLFNGSASASQTNVPSVSAAHFGFGAQYSSSSPVYVAPGTAGFIELTDSMCSRHSGGDNIGSVDFQTMSGYHPYGGC